MKTKLLLIIIFILLMTTSSLAQSNGYQGGTLETYQHGNIKGDLLFTSGNSKYSGELLSGANYSVVFDTTLPEGSKIKVARLYLYWTWSHNGSAGTYPEMNAFFKGSPVSAEKLYTDRKGTGTYDYPGGTYAYNVTDFTHDKESDFIVKNAGSGKFAINGAGLLLVYENPNQQYVEYWIGEGSDIIYDAEGVNPEQATTKVNFDGDVDVKRIKNANLITIVPGGNKGENTLYFNSKGWEGVYKGMPYADLAIDAREATGYVLEKNNVVKIEDKGDYLVPSNAFLIIKYSLEQNNQISGTQKTPGFGAAPFIISFLASISLFRCNYKIKNN